MVQKLKRLSNRKVTGEKNMANKKLQVNDLDTLNALNGYIGADYRPDDVFTDEDEIKALEVQISEFNETSGSSEDDVKLIDEI